MENRKEYQTEVTEMKDNWKIPQEEFRTRLDKAEKRISQLGDKAEELTQSGQQKENKI